VVRSDFFVYDGFMHPEALVSAGIKPRWMEPARLEGYSLAPRAGGFTLRLSGGAVYGVLVWLSGGDVGKFVDKHAGLQRIDAICTLLADRRNAPCAVLIGDDESANWNSKALMELARCCAEWRHPKRYIEWLDRMSTRQDRAC